MSCVNGGLVEVPWRVLSRILFLPSAFCVQFHPSRSSLDSVHLPFRPVLVAESPAGSTLAGDKVAELVTNLIDVVVQCVRTEGVRRIQNIRWQYAAEL